jgi:uridine kinase
VVAAVSPDEAVAAVRRALHGLAGTRWVGIDGLGASGKTTLAARIAARLPGAAVVHIDDFARPDLQGWERDRFVAQVLEPLLADRPARYQRWDWPADVGAEWHQVPTGVPVIVEGVSSTDVRLGVPWDLTLWVEVCYDERWRRIVDRDGPDRLDRWRDDWLPSEEAYVAAQHPQERADLIVLGSAP